MADSPFDALRSLTAEADSYGEPTEYTTGTSPGHEPLPAPRRHAAFAQLEALTHPAYDDPRIPVEDRVQSYVRQRQAANAQPEQVRQELKDRFGVEGGAAGYEADAKMIAARKAAEQSIPASPGILSTRGILERIPYVGTKLGVQEEASYREALNRIREGKATGGNADHGGNLKSDYDVVAQHERLQDLEARKNAAAQVADAGTKIPKLLGEMGTGGFVGGAAAKWFGRRAAVEAVAARAPTLANYGGKVGTAFGTTVGTPDLYAQKAEQAKTKNPGMSDAQAYAPQVAYATAQTLILQKLLKGNDVADRMSFGPAVATRTGVGVGKQQSLDAISSGIENLDQAVLGKTMGLDTKYGTLGKFAAGDEDAAKHLTVELATFALFSSLHGRDPAAYAARKVDALRGGGPKAEQVPGSPAPAEQPTPPDMPPPDPAKADAVLDAARTALDKYKSQGMSFDAAVQRVAATVKSVASGAEPPPLDHVQQKLAATLAEAAKPYDLNLDPAKVQRAKEDAARRQPAVDRFTDGEPPVPQPKAEPDATPEPATEAPSKTAAEMAPQGIARDRGGKAVNVLAEKYAPLVADAQRYGLGEFNAPDAALERMAERRAVDKFVELHGDKFPGRSGHELDVLARKAGAKMSVGRMVKDAIVERLVADGQGTTPATHEWLKAHGMYHDKGSESLVEKSHQSERDAEGDVSKLAEPVAVVVHPKTGKVVALPRRTQERVKQLKEAGTAVGPGGTSRVTPTMQNLWRVTREGTLDHPGRNFTDHPTKAEADAAAMRHSWPDTQPGVKAGEIPDRHAPVYGEAKAKIEELVRRPSRSKPLSEAEVKQALAAIDAMPPDAVVDLLNELSIHTAGRVDAKGNYPPVPEDYIVTSDWFKKAAKSTTPPESATSPEAAPAAKSPEIAPETKPQAIPASNGGLKPGEKSAVASKAAKVIARKKAEAAAERAKAVVEGTQVASHEGVDPADMLRRSFGGMGKREVIEKSFEGLSRELDAMREAGDSAGVAPRMLAWFNEVVDNAGLSAAERYVLRRRLSPELPSLEAIGKEPELIAMKASGKKGEPYTREAVRQAEKRALDKAFDGSKSVTEGYHKVVQAENRKGLTTDNDAGAGRGEDDHVSVAKTYTEKFNEMYDEVSGLFAAAAPAEHPAIYEKYRPVIDAAAAAGNRAIRQLDRSIDSWRAAITADKASLKKKGQLIHDDPIDAVPEGPAAAGAGRPEAAPQDGRDAGRDAAGPRQAEVPPAAEAAPGPAGRADAVAAATDPRAGTADRMSTAEQMLADRIAEHARPMVITAVGVPTPPPATGKTVREMARAAFEAAQNEFRRLAGNVAPAVSRLNEAAGDAVSRFAAAPSYGRLLAPHLTDKVMGTDLAVNTTAGKQIAPGDRMRVGVAIVETRLRHMRQLFLDRAATAHAEAMKLPPGPERDAKVDEYNEHMKDAAGVRTVVGQVLPGEDPYGEPLHYQSEADFQQLMSDPLVKEAVDRYRKFVVPVIEGNYRAAQGLDPAGAISGETQVPGLPVNLKAWRPGDEVGGGVVRFGEGTKGELRNPKARKYKYANEAKGNALGYHVDVADIINDTITHGAKVAAQAEMYRALVDGGLAEWVAPGPNEAEFGGERASVFRDVNPPPRTQAAQAGQTHLAVDPRIAGELRQALDTDAPFTIPVLSAVNGAITRVALASTTEAVYHTKNLLTFALKPGVRPLEFLRNAHGVITGDQAARDRVVDLARIGAFKESGFESGVGLLPEAFRERMVGKKVGGVELQAKHLDPVWQATRYMGKFLHALDKAMRLTADDAFARLKARGLAVGSEANRRDFINQLGQYNRVVQSRTVKLLRDTGFGPFATAATNYYMQGLRTLTANPGVRATSAKAQLQLRAEFAGKLLAAVSAAGLANYLLNGRVDGDDETPLGAVKVGGGNGTTKYLDLVGLTGLTRGMRETGLLAVADGVRKGESPGKVADAAAKEAFHSAAHPAIGPGVATGYTAYTGKNTLGNQVAATKSVATTDKGKAKAAAAGKPGAEDSQAWLNLQAALWNMNPTVAGLTGRDKPPGKEPDAEARAWKLLGPFGVKTREQRKLTGAERKK